MSKKQPIRKGTARYFTGTERETFEYYAKAMEKGLFNNGNIGNETNYFDLIRGGSNQEEHLSALKRYLQDKRK